MLNPSTATELANDPTIERCERRARALGFGAMRIANIFAYRATEPRDLRRAADPIGPDNGDALKNGLIWSDVTLCAWGIHGEYLSQGPRMARRLVHCPEKLRVLGTTKAGHPRHPLYVSYSQPLVPWGEKALQTYCGIAA